MEETIRGQSTERVFESVLDRIPAEEDVIVLAADLDSFEGLVEGLGEGESSIRVLVGPSVLKQARKDFLVAGEAANHADQGRLEIRSSESVTNSLVITENEVTAVVSGANHAAGLMTRDEEVVRDTKQRYNDVWVDADPHDFRTPALDRVRETLESEFGAAMVSEFDTVLSVFDNNGIVVDEIVVLLLVAARNDELLYDISRWGEDIGVGSKATFSRKKTQVEEKGLLETEKVPIAVGRPRLRLKLADERLIVDGEDEFALAVCSVLEA